MQNKKQINKYSFCLYSLECYCVFLPVSSRSASSSTRRRAGSTSRSTSTSAVSRRRPSEGRRWPSTPWRRPSPSSRRPQHVRSSNFLPVDLSSIHMFHRFLRVIRVFEFNVPKPPVKFLMNVIRRHIDRFDRPVHREYFHQVFSCNISCQFPNVNSTLFGSRTAFPSRYHLFLRSLLHRFFRPGPTPTSSSLLHGRWRRGTRFTVPVSARASCSLSLFLFRR